jgi:hypothetical protein
MVIGEKILLYAQLYPDLWVKESHAMIRHTHAPDQPASLIHDQEVTPAASADPTQGPQSQGDVTDPETQNDKAEIDSVSQNKPSGPVYAPKDFKHGPWLNPSNST